VRTYDSLTIKGENIGGDLLGLPSKTWKTVESEVNLMKNG
jgi:hypothetical protein